jgi:hypothetical protein
VKSANINIVRTIDPLLKMGQRIIGRETVVAVIPVCFLSVYRTDGPSHNGCVNAPLPAISQASNRSQVRPVRSG